MLVGTTNTSHGALNAHSYGRTERWGPNAMDGIFYPGGNLVEGFDQSGNEQIVSEEVKQKEGSEPTTAK